MPWEALTVWYWNLKVSQMALTDGLIFLMSHRHRIMVSRDDTVQWIELYPSNN